MLRQRLNRLLLQPQQRRLRRLSRPMPPHQNPTILFRVPIISSTSSFAPFLAFSFIESISLCRSLLINPNFSRSASRDFSFGGKYLTGVGAFRQESTILSRRSPPFFPAPPAPDPGGLAPFFLGMIDLFNGAPSLVLPFPFAVLLTEHPNLVNAHPLQTHTSYIWSQGCAFREGSL
ncbi:hypothetical protein ACHQM5_015347 [Ranunculus cassubicifolius]